MRSAGSARSELGGWPSNGGRPTLHPVVPRCQHLGPGTGRPAPTRRHAPQGDAGDGHLLGPFADERVEALGQWVTGGHDNLLGVVVCSDLGGAVRWGPERSFDAPPPRLSRCWQSDTPARVFLEVESWHLSAAPKSGGFRRAHAALRPTVRRVSRLPGLVPLSHLVGRFRRLPHREVRPVGQALHQHPRRPSRCLQSAR